MAFDLAPICRSLRGFCPAGQNQKRASSKVSATRRRKLHLPLKRPNFSKCRPLCGLYPAACCRDRRSLPPALYIPNSATQSASGGLNSSATPPPALQVSPGGPAPAEHAPCFYCAGAIRGLAACRRQPRSICL